MKANLVLSFLLVSAPVDAAPFAISCKGTSFSEDTVTDRVIRSADPLPEQVYVIDPEGETVLHALRPRQEFEAVCALDGKDAPSVSISPGVIMVDAAPDFSPNSTECSLKLDRKSGKGEHILKINFADGKYHQLRWDMTCEKTAIPIFDTSKNRF